MFYLVYFYLSFVKFKTYLNVYFNRLEIEAFTIHAFNVVTNRA